MEFHKERALSHFIEKSGAQVEDFIVAMRRMEHKLMSAYYDLSFHYMDKSAEFLYMMILDGCFILEIIRASTRGPSLIDPNDPLFGGDTELSLPLIRHDMLLFENQVPFVLLQGLMSVHPRTIPDTQLLPQVLKFFSLPSLPSRAEPSTFFHILEIYRESLIFIEPRHRKQTITTDVENNVEAGPVIIPSATKLYDVGIHLRTRRSTSLADISFKKNTLKFPPFIMDMETESRLLNVMAFERFNVKAGNTVTTYVYFMNNLLKETADVKFLYSHGIFLNTIGTDEEVFALFGRIGKVAILDQGGLLDHVYYMVHEKLRNRFVTNINRWRMDLYTKHFKSPWATVSLIGALILFILTMISTVYIILSYVNRHK